MFNFHNRVVMVAGASGNLGQAVSRAFWNAGAQMVLLDRVPERLKGLYPELVGAANHSLLSSVDVTNEESVERAVQNTMQKFGRIDVLANTVGGYKAGFPVHETSVDTWDFMMGLNARTAFLLSRSVLPHMLAQRSGKLVHVAARAALKGMRKASAYSASKSALIRLVESMAAEYRHQGINVNCVLPGTIDTPQNRESMPKADFERWVSPQEIAAVMLFLASDDARAVNGVAVPVYGRS